MGYTQNKVLTYIVKSFDNKTKIDLRFLCDKISDSCCCWYWLISMRYIATHYHQSQSIETSERPCDSAIMDRKYNYKISLLFPNKKLKLKCKSCKFSSELL